MHAEQREKAAAATLNALKRAGWPLSLLWTEGPSANRGHPFAVDARGRRYPVRRVVLTRIAPSDGLDRGDNDGGALKRVRDGVARALGVDDRNNGDGSVAWRVEQERGQWGVRVEIESSF
jgi:hypothetical protein